MYVSTWRRPAGGADLQCLGSTQSQSPLEITLTTLKTLLVHSNIANTVRNQNRPRNLLENNLCPRNELWFEKSSISLSRMFSWIAVSMLAIWWTGCSSTNPEVPKTDSLAALVIYGADNQDIRQAARSVFLEDQFLQAETNATLMTFEKRGSIMQDITYGSFMNNEAWIRAKLTIEPLDDDKHLLECGVFVVRNHGESFFEEESKVNRFKRGHYQDLLEKIRVRVLDSSVPRQTEP